MSATVLAAHERYYWSRFERVALWLRCWGRRLSHAFAWDEGRGADLSAPAPAPMPRQAPAPTEDGLPRRIPDQALGEIEQAHRDNDRCDCGLPLDPPRDQNYYWPPIDAPDPQVSIVVRYGEHPTYRRAVRVPSGWMTRGASVDGSGRPSAIVAWTQVGRCWAGTEHPVVAVNP